jgi:peptide subunit release factor 1 (eRF1)
VELSQARQYFTSIIPSDPPKTLQSSRLTEQAGTAHSISSDNIREDLLAAIHGADAFRHFKGGHSAPSNRVGLVHVPYRCTDADLHASDAETIRLAGSKPDVPCVCK